MATISENLIPFTELTEEEHRNLASMGGKASVESRRRKKTLKEELEILLELMNDGKTNQEKISIAILEEAQKGNTKAFEIIRDTIGEKPTDNINMSGNTTVLIKDDISE